MSRLFKKYFLILSILGLIGTLLSACSKSNGKRKSTNAGTLPPGVPTPDPTPADPNVGTQVPPITSDNGSSVITGDKAELKHFILQTKTGAEAVEGRYTDEFLFVVHSNRKSCVRLSVRPGSTITPGTDIEKIPDIESDIGACEKPAKASLKESLPLEQASDLEFSPKIESFALAAPNYALCSSRVFRMQTQLPNTPANPLGESQDPSKVSTKLGTLVSKSGDGKVLVWADQEWLPPNSCQPPTSGSNGFNTGFSLAGFAADYGLANPFGPLWDWVDWQTLTYPYRGYYDVLLKSQFTNLAESTASSLSRLTSAFGSVSDVDGSGSINLFISPDVNRTHSQRIYQKVVDKSLYFPFYKPMDLAAYNSVKNPSSNESETVYLWASSPGGVYEYDIYPSSNSLNSSFAYGYIGTQIMNLILDNQKLLKGVKEDPFLRESLSLLGGTYAAGTASTWQQQAYYLASHSQFIPLTGKVDPSNFSSGNIIEGVHGQIGMRALFGWYLHSKLCAATSATPCDKVKDLIQTTGTGKDLVAKVLGIPWATSFTQFSAGVGLGLISDTDVSPQTIATRVAEANKASSLPAPIIFTNDVALGAMPSSEVVSAANPINVGTYTINAANETPVVSPTSSPKALLFQPILPDNSLDLVLEADSVSYILVTGIVSENTDITAFIGPGTWVTALPIGQRNELKRAVYQEKLGQDAYLDLRPVNLTDKSQAPLGANSRYLWELSPRVVSTDNLDYYTVTESKELWITGSVANTDINVEGKATKVGDSDAYLVKFDPCSGPCAANEDYTVLVQTYTRPGSKNFVPMTVLGPINKTAYHGAMAWGNLKDIDPDYKAPEDGITRYPWLCQSGQLYSGSVTETAFCNNGGYNRRLNGSGGTNNPLTGTNPSTRTSAPRKTGTNFYTKVCNASEANQVVEDACWDGRYDSPAMFDSRNRMDFSLSNSSSAPDLTNYGYGIMGDNFLMSAYGFPYDTTDSIRFDKEVSRYPGPRSFSQEEANRMFYNFELDTERKTHEFEFHAARSGFSVDPVAGAPASVIVDKDWKLLSDTQITTLSEALRIIANPGITKPLLSDDPFVTSCTSEFVLSAPVCQLAGDGSSTTLFVSLQNKISELNLYGICRAADYSDCDIYDFFIDRPTSDTGGAQDKLFPEEKRFIHLPPNTDSASFETYYKPLQPRYADSSECHGNPIDDTTGAGWNAFHVGFTTELEERRSNRMYPVKCSFGAPMAHEKMTGKDIREQFWLPAKYVGGITGTCSRFPDQSQLCFDNYSYDGVGEKDGLGLVQAPTLQCDVSTTDRTRDVRGVINFTKGEVSSMPRRISASEFSIQGVNGPKNSTYATIMVGGTEKSEGDYLIRIRIFKSRSCERYPDGVLN